MDNQRRTVFLTGFMGAGKTSVGRVLAQRLGWNFADLDDLIVARGNRSVAEIFSSLGQPAFRRLENEALRALLNDESETGQIVALGGGAYAQAENRALLRGASAPVVHLDAPVEELRRRCAGTGDSRPLFQDENQFRQLYEARRSGYMAAGFRVDTLGKSVEEVAAEVATLLRLDGAHEASQ